MNLFVTNLLRPLPLALAAAGAVLALLLGAATPALLGLGCAALVAGAAAMSPTRKLAHRLARAPGLDAAARDAIARVGERLRALRARPGAGREAYRGLEQLDACHHGYLGFVAVLDDRFERAELTYGRYLEAARQVYLGTIDDLGRAATALEAIAAVDAPRLRSELRQLERREPDGETGARRLEGLRAQVAALDAGVEEANGRLARNDAALGELGAATGALAAVETRHRLADGETAETMRELEVLAERAHLYSIATDAGPPASEKRLIAPGRE